MDSLINEGENLLSLSTINTIKDTRPEVVNDMREAARALAFEIPTAVGFHLYRAIEAIVREYFPLVGLSRSQIRNPSLGTYVQILNGTHKKIHITPINEKITVLLDHIVKNYRNPIMHPDSLFRL